MIFLIYIYITHIKEKIFIIAIRNRHLFVKPNKIIQLQEINNKLLDLNFRISYLNKKNEACNKAETTVNKSSTALSFVMKN